MSYLGIEKFVGFSVDKQLVNLDPKVRRSNS